MPLTISSTAIQEKNKLATDSVWHLLMLVTIPAVGGSIYVRVTSDNTSVTWAGQTWQPFPFEIAEISEEGKGEVPKVEVRISNINRVMETYILAYDTYIKDFGYTAITVNIYLVNSKNLGSSTPEVEHVFDLKQPKTTALWATFTLGANSPYNRRFPPYRIIKNRCRFVFKDMYCGYTSVGSLCDKTITACRSYSSVQSGQNARFGGFPGVGAGGFRI